MHSIDIIPNVTTPLYLCTKLLSSLSLNVGVDHLCTTPLKKGAWKKRLRLLISKCATTSLFNKLFEDKIKKYWFCQVDLVLIFTLRVLITHRLMSNVFQYIRACILHFGNSNQFVACHDGTRFLQERRLRSRLSRFLIHNRPQNSIYDKSTNTFFQWTTNLVWFYFLTI